MKEKRRRFIERKLPFRFNQATLGLFLYAIPTGRYAAKNLSVAFLTLSTSWQNCKIFSE